MSFRPEAQLQNLAALLRLWHHLDECLSKMVREHMDPNAQSISSSLKCDMITPSAVPGHLCNVLLKSTWHESFVSVTDALELSDHLLADTHVELLVAVQLVCYGPELAVAITKNWPLSNSMLLQELGQPLP